LLTLVFACLLIGYLIITLMVFVGQRSLIYHPSPLSVAPDLEGLGTVQSVEISHEGVRLKGWLIRPDRPRLLIYYGGNNEELSRNVQDYRTAQDWAVLLVNYRGFGESEGEPTESALFADALYTYDEIAKSYEQVVVAGRSLGTGIATYVASQRPVSGVILITPYDSLTEVAKLQYPWLPVSLLIQDRYESIRYCESVSAPTLMILAGQDTLIPNERSHALAKAWQAPVETLLIPQATHGTISNFPEYYPAIVKFLRRISATYDPAP